MHIDLEMNMELDQLDVWVNMDLDTYWSRDDYGDRETRLEYSQDNIEFDPEHTR